VTRSEGGGVLTYRFRHPVLEDTKERRQYPGQTCISDGRGLSAVQFLCQISYMYAKVKAVQYRLHSVDIYHPC